MFLIHSRGVLFQLTFRQCSELRLARCVLAIQTVYLAMGDSSSEVLRNIGFKFCSSVVWTSFVALELVAYFR